MDGLVKRENGAPQLEDAYRSIRGYVIEAQGQVYTAVNAAMVTACWKIGKSIFEACGENDRAAYGKQALIGLKTGLLTRQDIGQMQMSVDYFTRYQMNEGDNPPVGLLLRARKSNTLVQLTLPEDNRQIYAAKYMPYLPTVEELKRELRPEEFEKLEDR